MRAVRDATPSLHRWRLTRDGTLLRIEGDWCQGLTLQREKRREGWFANTSLECLAVWAKELSTRLSRGRGEAVRFLEETRESSIDELGPLE
jgi:hypothetical protein